MAMTLRQRNRHHKTHLIFIQNAVGTTLKITQMSMIAIISVGVVKDFLLLQGDSIPFLKSKKWRQMRVSLTSAYTGSKMRQMLAMVADTSNAMVNFFTNEVMSSRNNVDVQIQDLFSRCISDVIASTVMDSKVNSFKDEKNDMYINGMRLTKLSSLKTIFKLIGVRIFPAWMKMLDISISDAASTKFFRTLVTNKILNRERQGIFRPDMINILMNLKKGNLLANVDTDEKHTDEGFAAVEESHLESKRVERKWTNNELAAQCTVFFFAGQETLTTILSFMAHALAVNPDIQKRLYEEFCDVDKTANGKLTYEALKKMKYLDMVVSETLRMWPPIPMVDRDCVKDYEYDDGSTKFTFEKGLVFWIPIYALHHDENYFPEPNKFDPERFSSDNKDCILPGTYIPFGVGPRSCIASRYALLVVKCIIYYLVLCFQIETNEKTEIPIKDAKQSIGLSPGNAVHLSLISRK